MKLTRSLLPACLALSPLVTTPAVAAPQTDPLRQLVAQLRQQPDNAALRAQVQQSLSRLREPTDAELLSATPLPRARMELIWLDPPKLKQLAAQVTAAGGRVTTEFYDAADADRREVEVTAADIRWAQEVEKVVDFAYDAGQNEHFGASVKFYKQALLLAPGGDLFLMSIGVACVQLGERERGLRFLERAAQITPTNGRIRRNLQAAKGR